MKKRSNLRVCLSLIGLVKPLTLFMILAVTMGVIGHLCASFITILGTAAVLRVLNIYTNFTLLNIFIAILILALMRGILHYGEQYCNHYIAFKILALIRDRVFKALRRLCPAKLEGKDKGNLISVITSDIELLEVFYAHTISPILIAILMSLVMVVFVGFIHPVLALISILAYISVGVLLPIYSSKLSGECGLRFRNKSGELSSYILESLRGLSEILQYGIGSLRLKNIKIKTDELLVHEEKLKNRSGIAAALTNSIILFFNLVMLVAAILLYNSGAINFAGILIALIALMSSYGPVIALSNLGVGLQNTLAAGNRVIDILEEEPVTEDIVGKEECEFGGINVENIEFSYLEEKILSGLNLNIEPKNIVGISGKSGSGKSTLLRLLMRFWKVNSGEIKISGKNIEDINTSNLRNMESFVTQETHLFHDSIRNNVKIAKLDASDEEVEIACKKAAVHDFINTLPQKYDTPVGELGGTLSGGERQRIGLARAFLHDAPLMLLDEPTSNLDSLNEAVILRSINEQSRDKTVVLVSHRESTMKITDRVYSVERGRQS